MPTHRPAYAVAFGSTGRATEHLDDAQCSGPDLESYVEESAPALTAGVESKAQESALAEVSSTEHGWGQPSAHAECRCYAIETLLVTFGVGAARRRKHEHSSLTVA